MKQPILLLNGSRGIYLPQAFAEQCSNWQGVTPHQFDTLSQGPTNDAYWETWNTVHDAAFLVHDGTHYTLRTSEDYGDLWAVPDGYDWENRD